MLACPVTNIISLLLMIAPTILGHFRFALNLILLPCFLTFLPMCARSLALLSRPSSVTTAVSLITLRPARSSSHRVSSFVCRAHTLLSKMVKPSTRFALLIILCALFFSRAAYHQSTGLNPSILPPTSLTVTPLRPSAALHRFSLSTTLIHPTLTFGSLAAPVIQTCPPQLRTNYLLVHPCVHSSVIPPITRVIDISTSTPTGSSYLVM